MSVEDKTYDQQNRVDNDIKHSVFYGGYLILFTDEATNEIYTECRVLEEADNTQKDAHLKALDVENSGKTVLLLFHVLIITHAY